MKKLFVIASVAFAVAGLASCCDKGCKNEAPAEVEKTAYTGILPAADCDGIMYTLEVGGGQYDMIETYFSLDTAAYSGVREIASIKSAGSAEVVDNDGKSYLKLTPSIQDSAVKDIVFLQSSDSTLTMVSSDFELPSAPENYVLKVIK